MTPSDGSRLKTGESILDEPTHVPAVWGDNDDVLWAKGEALFIVGPQGVGKSTLAQQLALSRAIVLPPECLGLAVEPDYRSVLYIAADRPRQILRSMRRMVEDSDREGLKNRLQIWAGPLDFSVVHEPRRLAALAESLDVGTVIIDSLKDLAVGLASDEVGASVNIALQHVVAAGIEVVVVHHNRKATGDNHAPRQLADVYGSTWLTAGAGSVISLWGEAGDAIVAMSHLKQPQDEVGPWELRHDNVRGITTRAERADAFDLLGLHPSGLTAKDLAAWIYDQTPGRNQVEKSRRQLERLVGLDLAHRVDPDGPNAPTVYKPGPASVRVREASVQGHVNPHAPSRNPGDTGHATLTGAQEQPPLKRGVAA